MNFTLGRDRTIISLHGHCIEFKKGVPTHVPPEAHREVLAVGAIPEADLPDDAARVVTSEPADPGERIEMLQTAFEAIIKRGRREDFTATGVPHAKALLAELGWAVGNKERDQQWVAFQTKG